MVLAAAVRRLDAGCSCVKERVVVAAAAAAVTMVLDGVLW